MKPNESYIAQPVRSLQTMLRVIAKEQPQLPTVIPDGIYGPSTVRSVAAFQRLNNIPVTGITDQNTWEEIAASYETAFKHVGKAAPIEILLEPGQTIAIGDSSPYIYLLQGMLAYLSETNTIIPSPTSTGILDEETALSLSAFQKIAALDETGVLDRITWFHLINFFTLNVHDRERLDLSTEI